jgi:hypothetical protein
VDFLKRVAITLWFLSSFALAVDGSISGTVTDPSSAVIANVPVSVTNVKTGKKTESKGGPAGTFGPIAVSSGEYKVRIHLGCFKRYTKVVKIDEGQPLEMSIVLYLRRGCTDVQSEKR